MIAAIVDTGPLVAFFDRAEQHHRWVAERIEELDAPLLVCEPVLAETMYLLAGHPGARDTLLELTRTGLCVLDSGLTSTSARYANSSKNIAASRCHSPTPALC
ncbi:MAG: PIN domain-containing protein [Xanthobacteraceae bacterium]|nr:PIN domain-containing protein [Xanthobacteraceae bacterium]